MTFEKSGYEAVIMGCSEDSRVKSLEFFDAITHKPFQPSHLYKLAKALVSRKVLGSPKQARVAAYCKK